MTKRRPAAPGGTKKRGARKKAQARRKQSTSVLLDADLYGGYAQYSAIADYVEAAAFQMNFASEIGLATVLEDLDTLPRDQFDLSLGRKQDTATDVAGIVFGLLAERRSLLGNTYPFDIKHQRITFKRKNATSYLTLLSIAFLHATKQRTSPLPTDEFEAIVLSGMSQGIVKARSIYERQPGNFRARVAAVAAQLMLPPPPSSTLVARSGAKDEGLDIVAHIDLDDTREGHWVVVAQATCGKSEIWEKKAGEASPTYAQHLFQLGTFPIPMIVIPHCIERAHLAMLIKKRSNVLIMDRIKLTRLLSFGAVTSSLVNQLKLLKLSVARDLAK